MLQFSRLDDLQNTGFDRLKIIELFGPVFSKLREARRKKTFADTIIDFTLSHVLSHNSNCNKFKFFSKFAVKFVG